MKVVSCANTWGVHSRHCHQMSSAVRLCDLDKAADKRRALVTVSNEAFLILALENNEERWPWHNEYVKKNPKKQVPRKDPGNKPKYSAPTSGPSFYGSWADAGRLRYIDLMNAIGDNRKNNAEKVQQADQAMLDYLRAKYKIAEKEANRKKKRKKNEPPPTITTIALDDSEDEDSPN